MTPHFLAHILHILESAEMLQEAVKKGNSYYSDSLVYEGMLRRLHTLSESAYKLPSDIKEKHPHVSWKDLYVLRNVLVHDYLGDKHIDDVINDIKNLLPALYNAMLEHIPNWEELKKDRPT